MNENLNINELKMKHPIEKDFKKYYFDENDLNYSYIQHHLRSRIITSNY